MENGWQKRYEDKIREIAKAFTFFLFCTLFDSSVRLGNPAVSIRPVTLRPCLSTGLPFSRFVYIIIC